MVSGLEARAVHDALQKVQTVTDMYRGDCYGCGECCSRILPLSPIDILRIKNYVKTHDVPITPEAPNTIDMRCPFLTGDKTCAIYAVRPVICKAYRCDKHANGTLAFELHDMKGYETYDMREIFNDSEYNG